MWQAFPSLIRRANRSCVSVKESERAWDQDKSEPGGIATSATPAVADKSKDLDDGWEREALDSGKVWRKKSTIARTGAEMEESSGSLSSLEGEEGGEEKTAMGVPQSSHHQRRHGTNADA